MVSFWFFAEVPGDIKMLANDPNGAVDVLTEGYEHLEQMGATEPLFTPFLAQALYANGQFEEAERKSELAASSYVPLARDLGKGVLSKVRARQGRLEEAERLAREAVASFDGTDLLIDHATALMALGEVLRFTGRMEEAASSVQQALDIGRKSQKSNRRSHRREQQLADQAGINLPDGWPDTLS